MLGRKSHLEEAIYSEESWPTVARGSSKTDSLARPGADADTLSFG